MPSPHLATDQIAPEPIDPRPDRSARVAGPRRSARPSVRGAIGALMAAGLVVALVGPASGASDPVESARRALAAATSDRQAADAAVVEVTRQRDQLASELERLGVVDEQLTTEMVAARRELREFAVAAYIDGGQSEVFRSSLSPEQAQALSWQASLSMDQSSSASEAAERFEELKEANSPARVDAAMQLDQLDQALEGARFDAIQAAAHERDAEAALARAESDAAAAAAARREAQETAERETAAASAAAAVTTPAPRTAAPAPVRNDAAPTPAATPAPVGAGMGGPTAAESATLAKIRQCESRGNYSIVSSSGRYRGAYQFDVTTWRAVGGAGDPAAAAPAEQDYRALLLLRMRGTRPWPHCGR